VKRGDRRVKKGEVAYGERTMKDIVRSPGRYQTRNSFLPAIVYFRCFSDGKRFSIEKYSVAMPSDNQLTLS
jgi:hypothetical protein